MTFAIFVFAGIIVSFSEWKNTSQEEKKLITGFVVFVVLVALSFFASDDIRAGFRHFEKYSSFLFAGFVYLYLKRLKINQLTPLVYSAITAPIAWLLYNYAFETKERLSGAYYAIFVGDMALLLACLSIVYLITSAKKTNQKIITILVLLISIFVTLLTESRGAWLYLPAFAGILAFLYRKKISQQVWVTGTIVIIIAMTILFSYDPSEIKRQSVLDEVIMFEDNPDKFSSVGVRIHMWKDSIRMLLDSPLIGVGVGDYRQKTQELISAGKSTIPLVYDHPHNIFLNMLATTGILGFLGLLIFIFGYPLMLFLRAWNRASTSEQKLYALSGIVIISGFAVFGLTESWISRNPLVRSYLIMLLFCFHPLSEITKKISKN
jgi:O-antigen ligase